MDPGTPRGEHTLNANIIACHIADLVDGSRTRRVSLLSAPAWQLAKAQCGTHTQRQRVYVLRPTFGDFSSH